MTTYKVKTHYSERCGYSVEVNGVVVFECLSEEDVAGLLPEEIETAYRNARLYA